MRSPDRVSRGRTISILRTLSSSLHRGSLVRLYHLNYRSEFITSILAFGILTIARSRPRGSNLRDRARAIEDDDYRILSCLVGAPAIRTQYLVTHAVLLGIVQVTEPDGTPFRQRGPCRRQRTQSCLPKQPDVNAPIHGTPEWARARTSAVRCILSPLISLRESHIPQRIQL